MSILETHEISYRYNSRQERPSVNEVSISIGEGRRTAILGANGAGKSTLFYHFNGVFKPQSGEVLYRGVPLDYSKDALTELRSEVCVVVQNPDEQIFSSTVEEDVAFGPLNLGLSRDEVEERITDALDMVGMTAFRSRPSTQLSYGQRKRVSLAGALAVNPKVMILDEPTAGLDPQMSQDVMELIDQLCFTGTSVIVSTHDVDLAYAWADDVDVLRLGRLVYSGMPEGFFRDPVQTAFAGLCRPHSFSLNSYMMQIRGQDEVPYPKTNSQLLSRMMSGSVEPGVVRIVPVAEGSVPLKADGQTSGAYGFAAKKAMRDSEINPDYVFDAVEMCMIDAVKGIDTVLYCDASIAEPVAERVRSLGTYGISPKVIL